MSGANRLKIKTPESQQKILRKLFDHTLRIDDALDIHRYIVDTFQCFAQNKSYLEINFYTLKEVFEDHDNDNFLDLFLFERSVVKEWDESKFERRDKNDNCNLIKPEIFKLFKNINQIVIRISGDDDGKEYYTLSFIGLLSIISNTNVRKVAVKIFVRPRDSSYKSWLELLWKRASQDLIDTYSRQQFDIKFDHDKDDGWITDEIIIERCE